MAGRLGLSFLDPRRLEIDLFLYSVSTASFVPSHACFLIACVFSSYRPPPCFLVVQVIIKWSIDWETAVAPAGCALSPAAPNLITTMINMFLSIGTVECQSLVRGLYV